MTERKNDESIPMEWVRYIRGDSKAEEESYLEQLLLEDDVELARFIESLDDMQDELPMLQDEPAFVELVMSQISPVTSVKTKTQPSKRHWTESSIFHYVIAASITMVLLSTGLFDQIFDGAGHAMEKVPERSYSEKWLDTTTNWLDQLKR